MSNNQKDIGDTIEELVNTMVAPGLSEIAEQEKFKPLLPKPKPKKTKSKVANVMEILRIAEDIGKLKKLLESLSCQCQNKCKICYGYGVIFAPELTNFYCAECGGTGHWMPETEDPEKTEVRSKWKCSHCGISHQELMEKLPDISEERQKELLAIIKREEERKKL